MGGVLIKKKMKFLLVPICCLTILLFGRNIITENFSSRISQKSWVTVEPEEAEDVLLNPGKGFVYYDWPLQQDEELIKKIQIIDSRDVELMQLADLLIGAVAYINRIEVGEELKSESKLHLIDLIKEYPVERV